jgi:hypothetical protein
MRDKKEKKYQLEPFPQTAAHARRDEMSVVEEEERMCRSHLLIKRSNSI